MKDIKAKISSKILHELIEETSSLTFTDKLTAKRNEGWHVVNMATNYYDGCMNYLAVMETCIQIDDRTS